jgi:cobalt/nickel transport system ATP-binding protein
VEWSEGENVKSIFAFDDVSYQYTKERKALHNVTFDIVKNRRTAIVGSNGAGKSTLVLHLNGLILPGSGTVSYMGTPITKQNREQMTDHVGMVFQDPDDQIMALSVFEDVSFSLVQKQLGRTEVEERTWSALERLHIVDLAQRSPHELSFGQKKLVAIAGVLASKTDVVVFDEPMAFLDPSEKREIKILMEELVAQGRTVVVTTHDMQLIADWADDCMVMKEGQCLGMMSPRQLFANRQLILEARLDLPPLVELVVSLWNEGKDGEMASDMPIRLQDVFQWIQRNDTKQKKEGREDQ